MAFKKRSLAWLAAAIVLGVIVLPIAVYFTGARVLGPYANGGLGQFMTDFLADLLRLRGPAVALAAGPAVIAALGLAFVSAFRR
jgi:hypothetical protein